MDTKQHTIHLNQITLGEKGWLGTKKGFAIKRYEIMQNHEMNGQGLLLVKKRIINFDHHDLTEKHCYLGCSRPPEVDGIKIFDKD